MYRDGTVTTFWVDGDKMRLIGRRENIRRGALIVEPAS